MKICCSKKGSAGINPHASGHRFDYHYSKEILTKFVSAIPIYWHCLDLDNVKIHLILDLQIVLQKKKMGLIYISVQF